MSRSLLQRLGWADPDESESRGALPDTDALSEAEKAELDASVAELISTPSVPAYIAERAAAQEAEPPVEEQHFELPPLADLRALIEDEIARASAPAHALWHELDQQFTAQVPDPTARAMMVMIALQTTHGYTPGHVLWDIDEAIAACDTVRLEIQRMVDGTIKVKVIKLETEAEAKRKEAAELRRLAQELETAAEQLSTEAGRRREEIDSGSSATFALIDSSLSVLRTSRDNLLRQHKGTVPEEPPGNVPPNS